MFALRPFARSVGLIDRPGGRKMHIGEIPVIGGVAMFAGFLVGSLYTYQTFADYPYLVAGLAVLVFVGVLDDRFDLPAPVRFIGQTCAVLLMVGGANLVVGNIGAVFFGDVVELGWFADLFTITIVVTAINAFNMFDGSDGVAGIQALMGLVFMGAACVLGNYMAPIPLIISMIGCLVGFLIFNWPSKRTKSVRAFMGDAGSTMLGFLLAWVAIDLSQRQTGVFSPVVVLWIFALPIFDLFSSMVRRVSNGLSPFHGDSHHLHHVLRRQGLSSRKVAQTVLFGSALTAGIGLGGYHWHVPDGALFFGWLAAGVIYHIIFGIGLFAGRKQAAASNQERLVGSAYWTWKQRRR
ncbi:MraY family glycosyltransferase [Steroidobacter sp.]|uniref:MraY family glycosyltransferase n=1 Tax=Steroidobacter sp. TaxID=1978227 RepID=UPI001A4D5392|nr:MraY family glycosyltransferase [Steroidobacter sp.]MBL8267302.1 undecaprenyl/decaprenyl-phosphate alpha-N-acetylglucosaminyl 1-phosphate transferase [Steroidobacter sp.]